MKTLYCFTALLLLLGCSLGEAGVFKKTTDQLTVLWCIDLQLIEIVETDIDHTFNANIDQDHSISRLSNGNLVVVNKASNCAYEIRHNQGFRLEFASRRLARSALTNIDYKNELDALNSRFLGVCLTTNRYLVELAKLERSEILLSDELGVEQQETGGLEQSLCSQLREKKSFRLSLVADDINELIADVYFLEGEIIMWSGNE